MLPHRDAFEKSLRMALDMAALREDTVGVALIHIGGYATYQRVFDSALANRLVEAAAKLILENLPEGRANLPRLARVSDDVIGVVLTDIRSRADADVAVEVMVKALKHPVDLDGQIFQLAPQAGVTLSGTDGARAGELIERALTTLDAGRRQGGNRLVTFYSDTLRLASLTRLDWQQELTQAIQKDELELHYQPRLHAGDARDRRRRSLPALAAQDPRAGAHFRIPAHRRAVGTVGAARPLGAAPRLPRSRHAGAARLPAAARLGERGAPVSVRGESRRGRERARRARPASSPRISTWKSPSRCCPRGRSGLAALHQLRGQGVRVLIDDFGTGYVSLGRLRNSPLDGIMIDRSFVEEVGHDHEARAVCRAAIALGLAFGLRIVAEGIETEAQAQFLMAEQCHEGQGHLFAPATPLATLLEKVLPAGKTAPATVTRLVAR